MFKKVFYILGNKKTNYLFFVLVLNFFGVFLEALGISAVLPLIFTITENNIYEKYPQFSMIFEIINYPEKNLLVVYAVSFFVSIFFIKNFFLSFLTILNNKFVYGLSKELSNSLFRRYLNFDYQQFLKKNSGKLMRNILNEINQFTVGIMMPLITIVTEIILFLTVFYILISYEPFGTLIIFVFLSIIFLSIFLPLKKKLKLWGKERQKNEGCKIDILNQGLQNFKDIKIFGVEKLFIKKYKIFNSNSILLTRNQVIIQQLPKYIFEIFAILSVSFLLIYFSLKGFETSQITSVLGLYMASIFRLMPSFNRILSSLQSLRFAKPILENLYDVFSETDKNEKFHYEVLNNLDFEKIKFEKEIEFKKVNFSYKDKIIFKNLDIKIFKNDFIGILGDSGSGKSTFIDLFSRLLSPQTGQIILDQNINLLDKIYEKKWQSIISYVPQKVAIFNDSIYSNITLSEKLIKDDEFFNQVVLKCNLNKFINNLKDKEFTKIGSGEMGLSGGQIQRIGIARAIYKKPKILILDEATNALDEENENLIMKLINSFKNEITVIIISHKKDLLINCSRIFKIKQGELEEVNV